MNNIVLFQPQIPANTGNIARTCVGTGSRLHLIMPIGFSIDDKHLKRAGLDYWEHLDLVIWDSLEDFLKNTNDKNYFLITKFGKEIYSDFDFSNEANEELYFIFGKETKGLPEEFRKKYFKKTLRIPITTKVRSLNLSNTVAMVLYEALRQQKFKNI